MLEKPNVPDDQIIACLRHLYGLPITAITFLPLGVDVNAAVYRAGAADGTAYFVKLRRGPFQEAYAHLIRLLADAGIEAIIPPLVTQSGSLWASVSEFQAVVYPFVDGQDGYQHRLSDAHWVELGRALRRIHAVDLPDSLRATIPQEQYPPLWREQTRMFVQQAAAERWPDAAAEQLAALLRERQPEILDLIVRAERLAGALIASPPEPVLCHADIHAGNVLIDAQERLHIVDWDNPILAPKERDLMYAGGAQFGSARTPEAEERLFYQGYGSVAVDARALAYYRCERIIEDIAAYCDAVLLSEDGGADRMQAVVYVRSNFLPGGTLAAAYRGDWPI